MEDIKRLEIMITQRQYADLKLIAKKEYRTVPSVMREMIDKRIKENLK